MAKLLTGEWFIDRTSARHRRILHYWATIIWLTVGFAVWIIQRDALWFVGFMSLYAIWITHIAGWAAETPVEAEEDGGGGTARAYGRATRPSALRTPVSGAAVQAWRSTSTSRPRLSGRCSTRTAHARTGRRNADG
jgi:hypothetical protein